MSTKMEWIEGMVEELEGYAQMSNQEEAHRYADGMIMRILDAITYRTKYDELRKRIDKAYWTARHLYD